MQLLIQQVLNGLSLGSIYAVFAIGFGLIFAYMGILNVAHGAYATWGVIPAFLLAQAGFPFWVTLPAGVLGAGLIGLGAEWFAFKPLRERGGGMLGSIIVAVGLWIILPSLGELVLGPNPTAMPDHAFPTQPLQIGGLNIPPIFIVNWIAVIVVAIGLTRFLARTRFGASIRSVGRNPETATIVGVDTRVIFSVTAILAGALAGLSGVLYSFSSNSVSFTLGNSLLLEGFAAVVIGGFGNIKGAVIAGISIGVIEALTAQYLSSTFRDAITFGLMLVFLVARPQGIFGELKVSRA